MFIPRRSAAIARVNGMHGWLCIHLHTPAICPRFAFENGTCNLMYMSNDTCSGRSFTGEGTHTTTNTNVHRSQASAEVVPRPWCHFPLFFIIISLAVRGSDRRRTKAKVSATFFHFFSNEKHPLLSVTRTRTLSHRLGCAARCARARKPIGIVRKFECMSVR